MRCGTNKRNIHPVLSGALVGGLLAASIEVQAAEKHEDPTDDSRGGYTPGIMYRADVLSNVSGGLKRGTRALGNLDATADFDLDRLAGWSGVSAGVPGAARYRICRIAANPWPCLRKLAAAGGNDAWEIF